MAYTDIDKLGQLTIVYDKLVSKPRFYGLGIARSS